MAHAGCPPCFVGLPRALSLLASPPSRKGKKDGIPRCRAQGRARFGRGVLATPHHPDAGKSIALPCRPPSVAGSLAGAKGACAGEGATNLARWLRCGSFQNTMVKATPLRAMASTAPSLTACRRGPALGLRALQPFLVIPASAPKRGRERRLGIAATPGARPEYASCVSGLCPSFWASPSWHSVQSRARAEGVFRCANWFLSLCCLPERCWRSPAVRDLLRRGATEASAMPRLSTATAGIAHAFGAGAVGEGLVGVGADGGEGLVGAGVDGEGLVGAGAAGGEGVVGDGADGAGEVGDVGDPLPALNRLGRKALLSKH